MLPDGIGQLLLSCLLVAPKHLSQAREMHICNIYMIYDIHLTPLKQHSAWPSEGSVKTYNVKVLHCIVADLSWDFFWGIWFIFTLEGCALRTVMYLFFQIWDFFLGSGLYSPWRGAYCYVLICSLKCFKWPLQMLFHNSTAPALPSLPRYSASGHA